jgi:hypothetical protein
MGTEPSDRCHPVLSHCLDRCGLGLLSGGCEGPRDGQSASVLTARVPGGSDLLRRTPTFTRASLSNVRVIMVIMRALVEEMLDQMMIG